MRLCVTYLHVSFSSPLLYRLLMMEAFIIVP
jgi:hypothetical protein